MAPGTWSRWERLTRQGLAPAKYVLAGALGEAVPEELAIDLASEVPPRPGHSAPSEGGLDGALATALHH